MQHFASLQAAHLEGAWLTIGAFDGVHRGHQQILEELTAGAHALGSPAVLLTFDPHPAEVLAGPRRGFYLTSLAEKMRLVEQLGLDAIITHPFTKETSLTPARDFVELIHQHLGLSQLWVGQDFALGHNRQGDLPTLRAFGQDLGYELQVVPPVELDGAVISSSRIRKLLAGDRLAEANHLLGRPYRLSGEVVKGARRGGSIGIPTANMGTDPTRLVPSQGVYAGWAALGDQRWPAVTNIGVRPTFDNEGTEPVVESHLLDYDGGDFYGQQLTLDFVARLRDEERFDGVDALLAQIRQDIDRAREILIA